jgi:hypothetical protein
MHGFFSCTAGIMKDHESRSADAASVTEEVRAFYEHHPYPPPVDSLEKYRRFGQDRQSRRMDYHLFWPVRRPSMESNKRFSGIVERTLPSSQTKSQLDMAHSFFEKLWWYDQWYSTRRWNRHSAAYDKAQ